MCRRTNSHRQTPKKVQFNDAQLTVNVVETASQDEKLALWYTKSDLRETRSSAACGCIDENDDSTSAVCQCKAEKKRQHEFVLNLLHQQREHKQMGMDDPKGLFQFSRACSKASRKKALQKGRDQAKEVKSFEERRQDALDAVDDALKILASDF